MAQKTEKEETEFKVPETLTLCVNNCGVTGNPATNNMCQTCFNAATSSSKFSGDTASRSTSIRSSAERLKQRAENKRDSSTQDPLESTSEKKVVNRCFGCRRRVGLTGFRCRCGELFCGEHRYSDRHACSFDYKAAGREAIARENPVVKAAKIVRV